MGFIVLSLHLAWRAAPYYGIELWQATGLVLVAYVVVALAAGHRVALQPHDRPARGASPGRD